VRAAGAGGDVGGSVREFFAHHAASSGSSPVGPNTRGKSSGSSLPTITFAIGDRQRSSPAVRRRSGIRAGGFGADAKARAVEAADRAAAGRDRVDAHHRRGEPHTGDLGDEGPLVLARVVRDVRRRAAHVEADDLVEAREPRNFDGADDAPGRSRQDRVLALEPMGIGQDRRSTA
jgi:hypothetical protein